MKDMKSRAIKVLAVAVLVVGVTATSSSAAQTKWFGGSICAIVDGCSITAYMGANGATSDDNACAGSVGEQLWYRTSDGVYHYSTLKWGTDFVAVYATTTVQYGVSH
jgi:hypothetical protein